jgi:hypothetical protein
MQMKSRHLALAGAAALLSVPATADAGGLRGSATSMREQHKVAVERDLAFIDDAAQVRALVENGGLEAVASNDDYALSGVSFPYALPEVRLFIERLSRQYREANGSRLVITSLTRPIESQPRNAHQLSVHPAGMAVDFRVPSNAKARGWLESALLQLENRGVLDVTRERFPPHYHVAIFPAAYARYAEKLIAAEPKTVTPAVEAAPVAPPVVPAIPQPVVPVSEGGNAMLLLFAIGTGGIVLLAFVARRLATA